MSARQLSGCFLSLKDGVAFKFSSAGSGIAQFWNLLVDSFGLTASKGKIFSTAKRILITELSPDLSLIAKRFSDVNSVLGPVFVYSHSLRGENNETIDTIGLESYDSVNCLISVSRQLDINVFQLIKLSWLLARTAEQHGGLLLHGALISKGTHGFVLAGRSGSGKTTACARIPPPFRVLSDDQVLVVKSPEGNYYGHPWPSWSRALAGLNQFAPLETSIKLNQMAFISQADACKSESCTRMLAVRKIVDSAEQTGINASSSDFEQVKVMRQLQFNTAVDMAHSIDSILLKLDFQTPFWDLLQ